MFALIASFLAQALGTTVTVAAVATAVQYAVLAATTIYGISSSRRQAKRQAAAYESSIRDRTVTIRSADQPRQIIYGRALVNGTVVYALGATDAQPKFFLVLELAMHECDGLEAFYANGKIVPLDTNGAAAEPGNYYREEASLRTQLYSLDSTQQVYLAPGDTLLSAVSTTTVDGFLESTNQPFSQIGDGVFRINGASAVDSVMITFQTVVKKSFIKVRFYAGTPDQTADAALIAASGGQWTSAHRLRGRCYAVVEVDPDPVVFVEGLPEFSFLVRGHKVITGAGAVEYSNVPAYCLRHYLRTYVRWPAAIIDDSACAAAAVDCAELVYRSATEQHARYTCDGVLSTASEHRENVATLLGSMAGELAFDNGQAVMRAGVYHDPTLTFTDDDIIGSVNLTGFAPNEEVFNAVRGRFFDGDAIIESQTTPGQYVKPWKFTDFPPYKSSLYASQDGGVSRTQEIDLPMTLDPLRAQRIAKLHLHRSRSAMKFAGSMKFSALSARPGKRARMQVSRYGWAALDGGLGKPFRFDQVVIDFERGRVNVVAQEEAESVYDAQYTEFDGRDPSQNTAWPTYRELAPLTGLQMFTGSSFVESLSDGSRRPYARVTWVQSTDPSVLASGRIDVEWLKDGAQDWEAAPPLDPYTTAYHVRGVSAGTVVQVRVRQRNSIAASPWAFVVGTVTADAGSGAAPSLSGSGVNVVANATLRSALSPWKYFDKDSGVTVTTDGGSPGGGSSDITIYLGGGASRPDDRPTPYGSVIWTETTVGAYTDRGYVFCDTAFPVVPGDVWELQCWLYLFRVFPLGPGLLYFDETGASVGTSWDDGRNYWSSSLPANHLSYTGDISLSQFYRQSTFCVIPSNTVQARWAYRIFPAPGGDLFGWPVGSSAEARIAMPFAARSTFRTIEAVFSEAAESRLSNWNGN